MPDIGVDDLPFIIYNSTSESFWCGPRIFCMIFSSSVIGVCLDPYSVLLFSLTQKSIDGMNIS